MGGKEGETVLGKEIAMLRLLQENPEASCRNVDAPTPLFNLNSSGERHFPNRLSLEHRASEVKPDRPFNLSLEKWYPT